MGTGENASACGLERTHDRHEVFPGQRHTSIAIGHSVSHLACSLAGHAELTLVTPRTRRRTRVNNTINSHRPHLTGYDTALHVANRFILMRDKCTHLYSLVTLNAENANYAIHRSKCWRAYRQCREVLFSM